MNNTLFIIPCFNEEKRFDINRWSNFIKSSDNSIDFLFIDDGSTDKTKDILASLESGQRIKFYSNIKNRGKGNSIRNAILFSINDYQNFGFIDADWATSELDIVNIKSKFYSNSDIDVIIGSRIETASSRINRKFYRYVIGRFFAFVVNLILKPRMYDSQAGIKIFKNTDFFKKSIALTKGYRWTFDLELISILFKIKKNHNSPLLIIEFPLNSWTDVGKSKVSIIGGLVSFFELIKIKIRLLKIV
jgi:hypothetical protein